MSTQKITVSEHRKRMARIGITLLSDEVPNSKTKVTVRFPCGCVKNMRPNDIYTGIGCGKCNYKASAQKRKVPVEKIRSVLEGKGVALLESDVERMLDKCLVRFPCGHEDRICIAHIYYGYKDADKCTFCAGKKHLTTEDHRARLSNIGIELLEDHVDSTGTPVLVRLICGHEGRVRPNDIYNGRNHRCRSCSGKANAQKRKLTINEHSARLASVGVKLLDYIVNSASDKALVRFPCGHIARCNIRNIYHNKSGCPICKESKGELMIARVLDRLGVQYKRELADSGNETNRRIEWDFYIPDYHAVIEYHGRQHHEYISFFHRTHQDFLDQQQRDQDRIKYARSVLFGYLMIPYTVTDDEEAERMIVDFISQIDPTGQKFTLHWHDPQV